MDKKTGTLVIHLPKYQELQVKRLAELDGVTTSEKGMEIIQLHLAEQFERFERMKSVFEPQE